MWMQMKMQDLVKTDRIYNHKKDDATLPDDEEDAEPLTGPAASSNSPAIEADEVSLLQQMPLFASRTPCTEHTQRT